MFLVPLLFLSASLTVQSTPAEPQRAQEGDILFTADTIYRQDEDGPVIAEGDVRASNGEQFVRADRVVYDVNEGTVTAIGNVAVRDESGQLYFADEVILSSDFSNGIVDAFAAELPPNGNLAAATAIRRESGTNELRRATFTLCPVCDEGFQKDRPVWQLRARKVIQDEDAKVLRFQNAFVEIFGLPTVYLPYAQVPDPSVKRASGFLAPQIGTSSRQGVEIEVPYYWAISDYQDFTFAPRHFTNLGTLIKGEYRRNRHNSRGIVQAGIINPTNDLSQEAGNPDDIRWHWFSDYERTLPLDWNLNLEVNAVSDKLYLLTYEIEPTGELQTEIPILRPDRLQSVLSFSRKNEHTFTDISGYNFQTLRLSEDQAFTGQALPRIRHDRFFDILGGQLTLGGSALSLQREAGLDSLRLSAHARYEAVKLTRGGHRFETFAELRGDTYAYSNADQGIQQCNVEDRFFEACRETLPKDLAEDSFDATRLLPTVGAEWSYPLARIGEFASIIIEPRVQAVISPERDFSNEVFNEDSQFFQFDTVTLFDYNKSSGLDLWEDGQRLNVGLSATATLGSGFQVNSTLGAQLRDQPTDAFADDTGLGEVQSDYVGAVDVRIGNNLIIDNRFRIDDETGSFRRLESTVAGRLWKFSGGLNYLRVESDEFEEEGLLDEFLTLNAGLQITRNISLAASQAQNLDSGSTTNTQVALRIANQCTALSIRYRFDDSTVEGFEQNRVILVKFDILGFN